MKAERKSRQERWAASLDYASLVSVLLVAIGLSSCGGGGGGPAPGPTPNPRPTITGLDPASATGGGAAFTLTVTGTKFISGSVVRWDGSNRDTTFKSSTQLTAAITAADIASGGTAQVTVFNPTPGGGTSNSFAFTINNPAPVADSLSPSTAVATGPAFTLTVGGSNFVPSSVVRWNGADRTTTFVSQTRLTAAILASDIATVGTAQVTVFNPAPGGAESAALPFTITALQALAITTTSLPATAGGKSYNFVLASVGGAPPVTWSLDSGTLPLDLTLDSATGRILGTVSSSAAGSTASFTVKATDSAATPDTATRPLSIQVLAGALSRNDVCTPGTATGTTAISNGRIRSSISPYGDIDVYSFQGGAGAQVTIEIFAQRLELDGDSTTRDSYLDAVTELLDSNCTQLTFNDDIDPGVIQDSLIQNYTLPASGLYFIRIRDFRGDGRPDLTYELSLTGAN